jgi:hypothetical protein
MVEITNLRLRWFSFFSNQTRNGNDSVGKTNGAIKLTSTVCKELPCEIGHFPQASIVGCEWLFKSQKVQPCPLVMEEFRWIQICQKVTCVIVGTSNVVKFRKSR